MKAFRDPIVTRRHTPYDELADFGVDYNSSMADVHRAGLDAQRRGRLTRECGDAWAQLRNAEKRLVEDLFHFQRDPAVFGGAGSVLEGVPIEPAPYRLPIEPLPPEILAAEAGTPEVGDPPPAPPLEPEPPLKIAVWTLLVEAWEPISPRKAPVSAPGSFLDE